MNTRQRMKLLYGSGNLLVSTTLGGGAATQIVGFINNLEKAGHQVDLDVSGINSAYSHVRSSGWLNWIRSNVPLSWLGYEAAQIINNKRIEKRLNTTNLRKYDFLWQRYELFTTAYAEAAWRSNLRHVFFVDAPMIIERQIYSHLWLQGLAIKALRRNLELSSLILAVSDEIRDYIHNYVKDPELEVKVVPNGFSEHLLNSTDAEAILIRQQYFPNFNGVIIGFVGSPKIWHRVDYLLQAVKRLAEERDDFRVLIVGNGPDVPNLKTIVKNEGLEHLVRFTGQIPFQDIAPYLHAIDIGVMPDSNLYGSPMKIAEYMACEAAVIAPDLPPIADFCTHEREGLLFSKDDVQGLYNSILRLINSPELRAELQQNGRDRAINNYSWTARISIIEELLYQTLAKK